MIEYRLLLKSYPSVDADERAYVAAVVLSVVDDLKPEQIEAVNLDTLPSVPVMRRILLAHAARMERGTMAKRYGFDRVAQLYMRRVLQRLKPDIKDALSRLPRHVPCDDVHDVIFAAEAEAERAMRDLIASGDLPVQQLATRMRPAGRGDIPVRRRSPKQKR